MTTWRESLRTSRARTAVFLVAVYIVIGFQGDVAEWLWFSWRGTEVRPELATFDTYSWAWLRESLIALIDGARWTIGWQVFSALTGITLCFVATKWLHALSWKDTFTKLGLPRLRRVEFTIPMIACIPGFAFIVLVFWPQLEANPESLLRFPEVNIVGSIVGSFATVITWGFLYKGLIQDARWKPSFFLLLVLVVGIVPSAMMMTFPGDHEVPLSDILNIVVTSAASLILTAWIFHHWNCRVWVLIFIALGSRIPYYCLPFGLTEYHGLVLILLGFLPYWLVMTWTWLRLRSEQPEVETPKRRVHA